MCRMSTADAPASTAGFPDGQRPGDQGSNGQRPADHRDAAAFTEAPHMPLYVIYPVVFLFGAVFLAIGLRNFRRRVLS